ncbi:MBG domain-containing protein, partial [Flavobacterium sp. ARAG 55.4]|uniref:MBG domain-containing protein n=1 Tax=Flavobacterium sp. ARAG 55.4 TaxID=3451357 RepID=UPI003F47DEAE
TGGTGSYTYSWSPSGGTAATATGLTAGTYTVTVTDANSCTATQSFTITEPPALVATAGFQMNVSCNGGTNGSATVSVTGGTPGYTYVWSPLGGTGVSATGLAAGTYTVTITDANSCQTTQSFTITQPAALEASTYQMDVLCNGSATGSAGVTASGGTGPYTYLWSPSGGTAASATGLAAGNYNCLITDNNGCSIVKNFTITQPTAMVASAVSQTNVSCNGGTNGSATVSATGGTGTYTYSWAPSGGSGATATGLAAGTYTVTVKDANLCQDTQIFTITEPTAIDFATVSLPGYDYNSIYSQSINVTGGTGTKTFDISSGNLPSGFNLSSTGLISGISTQVSDSNFTVRATDTNGCTATYDFTLKLNQIPITVTADASQTKVYGSTDPVFTYTVSPALLTGDSFTGTLSRDTGENIGNYEINQGTLSAGTKYLITYVSKDFAITAKPITVTADASQTKVYGTV